MFILSFSEIGGDKQWTENIMNYPRTLTDYKNIKVPKLDLEDQEPEEE